MKSLLALRFGATPYRTIEPRSDLTVKSRKHFSSDYWRFFALLVFARRWCEGARSSCI
jgi:hypothetical protein